MINMLHKAIKGYEDYLVTDTGEVYSLKTGKYLKPSLQKDVNFTPHLKLINF